MVQNSDNIMKHFIYTFFIFSLLLSGCKTGKNAITSIPEVEFEDMDTLFVSAPKLDPKPESQELPVYRETSTRIHDLIHTKLDISFNWEKELVIGQAELTLTPFFYATDHVILDAKNFTIESITLKGNNKPLKYDYDDKILTIQLDKTYKKDQEYTLIIDYIANPSKSVGGGSAAITSDQGLFFINPRKEEPHKPQQIWTQGETEHNSKWFPTIDKPNERCTQEMYITVNDNFQTLSNGLLISSNKNSDGTRTDYWKMDQPHAPYLFMITVGEFAIVKDKWKNIDVDYYVEKEFEPYAKDIFSNTTEMLEHFSNKLNVEFPWPKYSQIVVRDYVSGAMENTTGVIFGEFVQRNSRDLIDNNNERIVAHELFHHWFGDLVTCESWSNLTMNEGFANYGEYLWFEHKYGKDEADYHLMSELNGYISSSRREIHPLIYFGYEDKEDMFDAHSYNKGGLTLHMLRNYVGDDAFWASLNKYLNDHKYQSVEAHDLRLAFEAVTGQDLNWFFNQWFFSAGHPVLEISYDYDETAKESIVLIQQTQEMSKTPYIFDLPLSIDIYSENGEAVQHQIRMTERQQQFKFKVDKKPALINVDAEKMLLCEKKDNKTDAEWIFQYHNAKNFLDRYESILALRNIETAEAKEVFNVALTDAFYVIRGQALQKVKIGDAKTTETIKSLASNDPHSRVRAAAITRLAETNDPQVVEIAKKAIDNDKAYPVISTALQTLKAVEPKTAFEYAAKLAEENNPELLAGVSQLYAESGDAKYLAFFEDKFQHVDGYEAMSFFENYVNLFKISDEQHVSSAINKLNGMAIDMQQSPWRRIASTKSLNDARVYFSRESRRGSGNTELEARVTKITEIIDQIKKSETNDQIKSIYEQF